MHIPRNRWYTLHSIIWEGFVLFFVFAKYATLYCRNIGDIEEFPHILCIVII